MTETDRQFLFDLRKALLHLHKTLLDWERAAYERIHGRVSSSELLKAIVEDQQFGWLHPISEIIVHIDQTVDPELPESGAEVEVIVARARAVTAADEKGTPHAQRYHTALQEHPDAVFAHRDVANVLKTRAS
jgi:1,6-anhydro-N-acetylmuramate kinase